MLINSPLTNVRHDIGVVYGEAAQRSSLLQVNESVYFFDGVRNTINFIVKERPTPRHEGSSAEHKRYDSNFWFFDTYEDAIHTYLNDPASVVNYVEAELRPIEHQEQGLELVYGVDGDFIDIGRAIEGNPEPFGSLRDGKPRSRRVRIVNCISNVSDLTERDINHKSERIIRLIDALEHAHVPVEFIVVDSSECNHAEITVKRFDESLVIEDVAVATHSDFFRRLIFRLDEYSPTWRYGYGTPMLFYKHENLKLLKSTYNDEITLFLNTNMTTAHIDTAFDNLEKRLVEELSETVPKISLLEISNDGLQEIEF